MADEAGEHTHGIDRPTLEEIEVTEEMIVAGICELPALYSWRDDGREAVVKIYLAMASLALQTPIRVKIVRD